MVVVLMRVAWLLQRSWSRASQVPVLKTRRPMGNAGNGVAPGALFDPQGGGPDRAGSNDPWLKPRTRRRWRRLRRSGRREIRSPGTLFFKGVAQRAYLSLLNLGHRLRHLSSGPGGPDAPDPSQPTADLSIAKNVAAGGDDRRRRSGIAACFPHSWTPLAAWPANRKVFGLPFSADLAGASVLAPRPGPVPLGRILAMPSADRYLRCKSSALGADRTGDPAASGKPD
jgi:hypothetical protein